MPYARFDDRYDDHRKVKRAWRVDPATVGLHAMAITYSNRHQTDGVVDLDWIEEKLALTTLRPAQRKRVLDTLFDTNLFERLDDENVLVHDFLDWNLSREQRKRLAEQGAKGGKAKGKPSGTESQGSSEGFTEGSSDPGLDGSSTPKPTPTPLQEKTPLSAAPTTNGDVEIVFEAWKTSSGKTDRTVLSPERRKLIRNALKAYPVEDLVDAVDGWRFSPHHRGENDQHTVYNDIELLLRSSKQVEKFRDLKRNGGTGGTALSVVSPKPGGPSAGRSLPERQQDGLAALDRLMNQPEAKKDAA